MSTDSILKSPNLKKKLPLSILTTDSILKPSNLKKQLIQTFSDSNESIKHDKPPVKSIAAIRHEDWKSLLNSITHLFTNKKLQRLELDVLNEKVRNVRDSDIGAFILDSYKESILKKGMIVLREQILFKEKKGGNLLEPLGVIWHEFYSNILPTLQAIFYPIHAYINFRTINLIGFRDMVLLKTKIDEMLEPGQKVSKSIKQMLLILSSVHEINPHTRLPSENCIKVQELTARVVRPFLGVDGLYDENYKAFSKQSSRTNNSTKDRKISRSQMIKDEISKKLRRSGSASSNSSEPNNNREGSFTNRHRVGGSPGTEVKPPSVSDASELAKAMVDNDMLEYLEVRSQRWRSKEEMLVTESF